MEMRVAVPTPKSRPKANITIIGGKVSEKPANPVGPTHRPT